jgi:hypothetical protein
MQISHLVCGNANEGEENFFVYRSSSFLTEFFQDCGLAYVHDGSTRHRWVAEVLREILAGREAGPSAPPEAFARVVRTLMDQGDAVSEGPERPGALAALNAALTREGFEAFYGSDKQCYLRHLGTDAVAPLGPNPHRAFSAEERDKRERLRVFLEGASEDALIEEVLLPLFRQLGFQRVRASGHKDKALEYGNDLWMKFTLPTLHVLYFGIQAKKGKLDSSGVSKGSNVNVAEIYNQVSMMLGHELFDPETGRKVLVDHALIVAGGEITKLRQLGTGSVPSWTLRRGARSCSSSVRTS